VKLSGLKDHRLLSRWTLLDNVLCAGRKPRESVHSALLLAYCTAQHQFSDWVEQRKDYCTFGAVTEFGASRASECRLSVSLISSCSDVDNLMRLSREKLREVASQFCWSALALRRAPLISAQHSSSAPRHCELQQNRVVLSLKTRSPSAYSTASTLATYRMQRGPHSSWARAPLL